MKKGGLDGFHFIVSGGGCFRCGSETEGVNFHFSGFKISPRLLVKKFLIR